MDPSLIAALQGEYEVPVGGVSFAWHDFTTSNYALYEAVRKQPWWTSCIDARMEVVHQNIDAIAEHESRENNTEMLYGSPEFVIEWWLVGEFLGRPIVVKTTPRYMWETAPMSLLRIVNSKRWHGRVSLLTTMISEGEIELAVALLDGKICDDFMSITDTSKLETRKMHTLIPLLHLLTRSYFHWPAHKSEEFYACCRQLDHSYHIRQIRRVFALIMGVQDDYLKVRPLVVTYTQRLDFKLQFTSHVPIALRVFEIAMRLPVELQWHLACAVIGVAYVQKPLFDGDVLWMLGI